MLPYDSEILENKYGLLVNGVFYLNNETKELLKQCQNSLIKDFYPLLINKKNFDRKVTKEKGI